MDNAELENFVQKRPHLFWSVGDLDSLSEESVVEAVLNYGNFKDVKKLFSILGIQKVASIFQKQIKQKRTNYDPKISNYFKLYFRKHA